MIREAKTSDISAILALGQTLAPDARFMPAINPTKARKNLAFFMNSKRCLVLVAEHREELVGFIVGGIEECWYSDAQLVTDVAFYVAPNFRAYAPALVKRLRVWGQRFNKVTDMLLGVSTGVAGAARTGQMYERLGMQCMGGLYAQSLQGDSYE